MKPNYFPVNIHQNYHAHAYFNAETLDFATKLCLQAGELFHLKIGRIHQKPIGPHPQWSCQMLFNNTQFDTLIPWLDKYRDQLSVLIHALSGDNLKDHTDYAYWLGSSHELKLSIFEKK
jgi:aromatic ring-cleaving dioxygenase